jgi:2-polyprenyl-6-methoxyphenol hydroxylase-like FAD-dependent oxidoreductase
MGTRQRVLIVGGGIAGLVTVHALLRHGMEPDVVEPAAAWSHPGVGCTCAYVSSGGTYSSSPYR